MIYALIVLLLLSLLILYKEIKDKKKLEEIKLNDLKDYFRKEWEEEASRVKEKIDVLEKGYSREYDLTELKKKDLNRQIELLLTQLEEKEKRYNEVNQDLDLYKEGKIKEIDARLIAEKHTKELLIEQDFQKKKEDELKKFDDIVLFLTAQETQLKNEIEQIQAELNEFRTRRAAINEEIRRAKQIEEQQDFYRIQIDPNEINDIEILRDTARRLQRPEIINKIIWSGYYQKPLAELRKRLLPNGDISGVYKITRLKTNEIYIGQTTSIDKRWQEHVKSCLGVGTLASSQLHRVMNMDGPENFTFEVLEETPKEKLKERESYYIDFYDSKNYGLNTIRGEK